jgi:glycosyltransferase involved in cell wall biosynthesis
MFRRPFKSFGYGMNRDEKQAAPLGQISVVAPVKNEETSISQLLTGILNQTYKPSEVIITDGGSTDRTKEIIREHQASYPVPLILIETDYALPGRGRNLAIAQARSEWVACIDAGILPEQDWLAELAATAQSTPEGDVVYGNFEPVTDTYFTESAAITYLTPHARHRSIASCLLKRDAWEAAGHFREDLRASEDLLFFRALDKAGAKEAYSTNALVRWRLQPDIGSTFRRFIVYSRSGMRAGLYRDWQFNVARLYLLMFLLLAVGIFAWPFFLLPPLILSLRAEKRILNWFRAKAPERLWRELLSPRRVLTVAFINVVIDLATFYGMWQWFAHDRSARVKELYPNQTNTLD